MKGFKRLSFLALFLFLPAQLWAGPIYVVKLSNGSLKFTNKDPGQNVEAKVFTAKGLAFSRFYSNPKVARSFGYKNPKGFQEAIHRASIIYGVEQSLLKAVIHAESAFNPNAVSPVGAQGLMQLMPATARLMGVRNSFSPDQNIHGGAKYLAGLMRNYKGNARLAVAAYNAGPGAVNKYKGIPPYQETQQYVSRVLALRERYRASSYS